MLILVGYGLYYSFLLLKGLPGLPDESHSSVIQLPITYRTLIRGTLTVHPPAS